MFWPRRPQDAPVSLQRRVLSPPTLVSLALAGAFLAFLVTRFDVDLGATWDQIGDSNPWYLALALLVHYTTFLFRGARWRLLLQNTQLALTASMDGGKAVPGMGYLAQLVLLGWFANSVAWFRLGDAYRAYLYRQEQGASFSTAIGTILAERALDTILVVALLLAAVPFLISGDSRAPGAVLALAVALLGLLGAGLLVMAWARRWLVRRLPAWLGEGYQRFYDGALGSFRRLPQATLWGLLGWLAEVARLYLVAAALGLDLGLALVVFLTLANSLLTLVPTPGGFGAVESGVAGLAVRLAALPASAAAALVLVDRAISYLSVILVGAALFLVRQARGRRAEGRPAVTEQL
ncbi:MAG TPA: flippase-like domain-containing protein [Dehalococcoidia bacterium]|nr:flippase-like domain-containing protein [Dehalococcoidia bacterium]